MSLPVLQRIQPPSAPDSPGVLSRLLLELQNNVGAALDRLLRNPRHDFVTLSSQALAGAADTALSHRLGRVPQGWSLTDITGADATVRRVSWTDKALVLHASAAVTVNLEVW